MKIRQVLNQILAYEAGELDREEVIDLFQALIESGVIYTLQGHYQRTAQALIEEGYICIEPGE